MAVETENVSFFGRLLESIKGILVGLLMLLGAVPVLFLNECNSVETARSLDAGRGAVVEATVDAVDAGQEGALVHLSGKATTDETLSDEMFGVALPALRLQREVEMYQWKENKDTKTVKKGGSEKKVTTYTYEKVWDDDVIKSSGFNETKGHDNPSSMPYESETYKATTVTLGAYTLADSLVGKISAWEDVPVSEENKAKTSEDLQKQLTLANKGYFIGASADAPRIGDVRITFRAVQPTVVSVVAGQSGKMLGPWSTDASSYDVELLEVGTVNADDMFSSAESTNTILTWVLRGGGWFLLFLGLTLVFRPFSVMSDLIPFIGGVFRAGIAVFSFFVASGLWLVIVALSWLAVRPMLAIGLLVLAALCFGGLIALAVVLGGAAMARSKGEEAEA